MRVELLSLLVQARLPSTLDVARRRSVPGALPLGVLKSGYILARR